MQLIFHSISKIGVAGSNTDYADNFLGIKSLSEYPSHSGVICSKTQCFQCLKHKTVAVSIACTQVCTICDIVYAINGNNRSKSSRYKT